MADQEPVVEIYGDESLRRGSVDIVGAIWVESNAARTLRRRLVEVRAAHGWLEAPGEWKWAKASGREPHPAYLDLVRIAANAVAEGGMAFRALAVPAGLKRWVHTGTKVRLDHYAVWLTLLGGYTLPGCRYLVRLDSRTDLRDESLESLPRCAEPRQPKRGG